MTVRVEFVTSTVDAVLVWHKLDDCNGVALVLVDARAQLWLDFAPSLGMYKKRWCRGS